MGNSAEFMLDLFVYEVLRGNRDAGRGLVEQALARDPAGVVMAEIVWPTLECVQHLRQSESIAARVYNSAVGMLYSISEMVAARMDAGRDNGRSMLICTAPGEREELGAAITALVAEGCGWRVQFGGSGLSFEEITYAIGRLNPDVLVLHGAEKQKRDVAGVEALLKRLHALGVWPGVQLAVCGAVIGTAGGRNGADVAARQPVELMELLALCPEYRSREVVADPVREPEAEFLRMRWNLN